MKTALSILLTLAALGLGPALADPRVAIDRQYYDVDATTIDGLLQQMAARGPNGFWGYTSWYVRWSGSCRLSVDIDMTLPRHVRPDSLPDRVRQRWDRMLIALTIHEDQHARFGIGAAQEIEKAGCNGAYDILDKWIEAEKDFDRRTQHGRRDGVVLR